MSERTSRWGKKAIDKRLIKVFVEPSLALPVKPDFLPSLNFWISRLGFFGWRYGVETYVYPSSLTKTRSLYVEKRMMSFFGPESHAPEILHRGLDSPA